MSLGRFGRARSSLSLIQPFTTSTAAASPPAPAPSSVSFLAHHLLDEFSRPRSTRDVDCLHRLAAHLSPPTSESVILRLPSWRHALDFFRWAAEQPGFRHSCYSLNAMASILPPHQRAHLDRLAGEAVSSRCPMTPGALGFLLRRLGAAGLPDTAARVFDVARTTLSCTPNSYTYNCLLNALAKAGRTDDVEARLREMVARCGDESVDRFTLTSLLQCYCKAGRPDKANTVFQRMSNRGWVDKHVLTMLVVAFSKCGKVDSAVELVGRMETLGMMPNRLDEAYEMFNKMKDLGLKPTEFTYNSLFYGISRRKDPSAAIDLLREMQTNGNKPWIKNCTEMVQQLCFSGRITEALQFLDEMLKMGFVPDIVTYSAAMNGMCKTGEIDNALELFRDISSKYYLPDVVAHNILINGF
ncbi:hypothetical protein C2845_PM05G21250 [Panicum miliaceum]|uniref:Pentatricopeptide repeat-containing protein n=1 Tax=Panicum miliaceum TaxID=4540 RepID=A0A3L6SZW1_PANMI|nr:hypothetical protein C2845_PM05G21250 [Panicum miliaceum]